MKPEHQPVTVTLNPAIDETIFLDSLKVGEVNRSRRLHVQAGGKGINVSRMLSGYGITSTATGFLGQDNQELYKRLFEEYKLEDTFIRVPGETRSGIKIVNESARQTTDINFAGPEPSPAELDLFEKKLLELIRPGRWFVLAGSLPGGLDIAFFEKWIRILKQGGALVAVDTSGDPLRAAIDRGVDLIKPNEHELAAVLKRPLQNFSEKLEAARELQQHKVPRVILSLGSEGALFLNTETQLMARAPSVTVVSTVGAGDALLAGYLAGVLERKMPVDCARLATVFAWSSLENVERKLPTRETIAERMSMIEIQTLSEK